MKLEKANGEAVKKLIKPLYKRAFPSYERKPFGVMNRARKKGRCDFLAIKSGEKFVGFMITVPVGNAVLLDYFAVCEDGRGKGTGCAALSLLKEYYAGKSLVLEAELPEENEPENSLKRRRIAFYERNGFVKASYNVKNIASEMQILCCGEEAPFEAVYRGYVLNAGRFMTKFVARLEKVSCTAAEKAV